MSIHVSTLLSSRMPVRSARASESEHFSQHTRCRAPSLHALRCNAVPCCATAQRALCNRCVWCMLGHMHCAVLQCCAAMRNSQCVGGRCTTTALRCDALRCCIAIPSPRPGQRRHIELRYTSVQIRIAHSITLCSSIGFFFRFYVSEILILFGVFSSYGALSVELFLDIFRGIPACCSMYRMSSV